jgi:hypothetical protein
VPYGELDALRFKEELETARRELEDVSKKAGIAEAAQTVAGSHRRYSSEINSLIQPDF